MNWLVVFIVTNNIIKQQNVYALGLPVLFYLLLNAILMLIYSEPNEILT